MPLLPEAHIRAIVARHRKLPRWHADFEFILSINVFTPHPAQKVALRSRGVDVLAFDALSSLPDTSPAAASARRAAQVPPPSPPSLPKCAWICFCLPKVRTELPKPKDARWIKTNGPRR